MEGELAAWSVAGRQAERARARVLSVIGVAGVSRREGMAPWKSCVVGGCARGVGDNYIRLYMMMQYSNAVILIL